MRLGRPRLPVEDGQGQADQRGVRLHQGRAAEGTAEDLGHLVGQAQIRWQAGC